MSQHVEVPRFVFSYRGAADYVVKGRKYSVRSFAHDDGYYNGNYFAEGVRPLVGCVRSDESAYWHQFPPAEVLALFPDHVGARFTQDYGIEYVTGHAPEVVEPRAVPVFRATVGVTRLF